MVEWRGWYWRRAARRAARASDWTIAIAGYRRLLGWQPGDARAWIQLGHAYKEEGRLADAADAYDRAVEAAPDIADAWLQSGRAKALNGDREGAIGAFGQALEVDPHFVEAARDMIAAGARNALPSAARALHEAGEGGERVFAPDRYEAWREHYAVPPAPTVVPTTIRAIVDARRGGDAAITSASIAAQTVACASLSVWQDGDLSPPEGGGLLIVAAGTTLHQEALAWLLAAAERTGAASVFCDFEEWGEAGARRPMFQPMYDPLWFAGFDEAMPVLLVAPPGHVGDRLTPGGIMAERSAHLPLLLAARPARPGKEASYRVAAAEAPERVQVVIQTRDEAEALRTSVESLIEFAHRPDLLDIVVVDNRSVEPDTVHLIEDWERQGIVRVIGHDEPFNWARANNIAIADAPFILFLNNDTEMLSEGWDSTLRRELRRPDVGLVGALLLYPVDGIQHAGVIMGMEGGGPLHEGVMQSPECGGPQGRWVRNRYAAAVTGAWMAMRHEVFDDVGGFDERFAVAFNDIDLCLAVRAAGLHVVYCAKIVSVHHESLTRGLRLDAAQVERNRREFKLLAEKWGGALRRDPGYNPHWAREGRPFDGLRFPTIEEVFEWLDRSASGDPWVISRQADGPAA